MNAKQKDIHILFGIIVCCITITLFHVRGITAQNKNNTQSNTSTQPLASLNTQDALDYIMPLLITGNLSGAAQLLMQTDSKARANVIDLLFSNQGASLDSHAKLLLLLSLAKEAKTKPQEQTSFFEKIKNYKAELPYTYTLQYAAQESYQDILEPLIAWIQHNSENQENSFESSLYLDGLKAIIDNNKTQALEAVLKIGPPLPSKQATKLLSHVINQQKSPQFVTILAKAGADTNYIDTNNYSLLMHAINNNNTRIVRALLQEGANPNILSSPSIGTPLQYAIEKRYTPIELLLRQYGGKE